MKLFKKFGKKHIVVLIIVLAIGIFVLNTITSEKQPTDSVLASVNGETITLKELNEMYKFSEGGGMSKNQFLNDVLIPHKLLLQKAKENRITVSKNEVDFTLALFLKQKNWQLEAFQQKIDLSKNKIREYMEEQVFISKLVKEAIPPVSISNFETRQFYDSHPDSFMTEGKLIPLEEVEKKVKEMLFDLKLKTLVRKYVIQLAEQGEVLIYSVE